MKKIKIHSILSNSDNETTIVDEEVMFDEVDNVITYMEDDLKVSISIFETLFFSKLFIHFSEIPNAYV